MSCNISSTSSTTPDWPHGEPNLDTDCTASNEDAVRNDLGSTESFNMQMQNGDYTPPPDVDHLPPAYMERLCTTLGQVISNTSQLSKSQLNELFCDTLTTNWTTPVGRNFVQHVPLCTAQVDDTTTTLSVLRKNSTQELRASPIPSAANEEATTTQSIFDFRPNEKKLALLELDPASDAIQAITDALQQSVTAVKAVATLIAHYACGETALATEVTFIQDFQKLNPDVVFLHNNKFRDLHRYITAEIHNPRGFYHYHIPEQIIFSLRNIVAFYPDHDTDNFLYAPEADLNEPTQLFHMACSSSPNQSPRFQSTVTTHLSSDQAKIAIGTGRPFSTTVSMDRRASACASPWIIPANTSSSGKSFEATILTTAILKLWRVHAPQSTGSASAPSLVQLPIDQHDVPNFGSLVRLIMIPISAPLEAADLPRYITSLEQTVNSFANASSFANALLASKQIATEANDLDLFLDGNSFSHLRGQINQSPCPSASPNSLPSSSPTPSSATFSSDDKPDTQTEIIT